MKTYRVGVFYEVGGYIEIDASSKTEAEEKALELLQYSGEENIEDVTHRDYQCISDTEEL